MMTTEKHLRKAVLMYQKDSDERLPIFLLPYGESTYKITGMTHASMVLWRELCLPCNLLFKGPPSNEKSTTDYVMDLVDQLHDIQHYAC
jgi:hypothetical protein